jgi:hypothetical protein
VSEGCEIEVDGELRVWPRQRESKCRGAWYEQRFLPTLEALRRLDVERMLVAHGKPVVQNGAGELAASLKRAPWRRSSVHLIVSSPGLPAAPPVYVGPSAARCPHGTDVHVTVPTASPAELIVTWIAGLLRRGSLGNRFVVVPTAAQPRLCARI